MGTPTFGLPAPGNNAPLPIPGNTNPTGTNSGVGYGGASFPLYPMYGAPSTSPVSPSANAGIFGTGGGGGIQGLTTGAPTSGSFGSMLNSTYGSGFAAYLDNIFKNGLFNPQVAEAFLNAMQPGVQRGQASILDAFGAEGSRFGSAAALGLGDFNSQVNLNEQQTLAGMFMQAQQEQLSLLENVLPSVQHEKANQGSWVDDLVGSLEIAGSIAAAPFTGGMSLMGLGAGMGTLSKGLPGGGGGGGGNIAPIPLATPPFGMGGYTNTGTFGANAPSAPGTQGQWEDYVQWMQEQSAGASLGGNTPSNMLMPTGEGG